MKIGDIYRFTPEFLAKYQSWVNSGRFPGHGPFEIIAIRGSGSCDVKSLEDGRIHKNWAAAPPHWGEVDNFLTAAHKANNGL